MNVNPAVLTGKTETHLVAWEGTSFLVHSEVAAPLSRLKAKAAGAGFDLCLISSFRGHAHQLKIWNAKAQGKRPLLDAQGKPLVFESLSPENIVDAILRWSALPGASRHHWGTDVDVFDRNRLPKGYNVQLIPSEVLPGGMFAPLHDWLDEEMKEEGFFRPYAADRGGVSPERWHLSYAPVAESYLNELSEEMIQEVTELSEMLLKDVVLRRLSEIYRRYIKNISPP
jgi:LAS superfamily LD-carboxypeptidase LdcB